jgi:hypothetical protein
VLIAGHLLQNRTALGATLPVMSNLDRRGGRTPRRVREQRAYRLALVGGTAGAIGVVSLVLAGSSASSPGRCRSSR